ncbi:MAG: TerB family tellurite resistance protein [Spirochaetaceae bacterium]|nr:TerB family tellurite resistance protein [Spirochaetaceae bacterium]
MFETDDKKQLFANWLWNVANADNNIAQEEIQIINNIGLALGLKEVKYKEIKQVVIDDVEKAFLLRELFRLAISDKDFADAEKNIIAKFIKEFEIDKEIVTATEKWANSYLENEKQYYNVINNLLVS